MLARGEDGRYVVYTGLSKWCPSKQMAIKLKNLLWFGMFNIVLTEAGRVCSALTVVLSSVRLDTFAFFEKRL